jgi:ribosomal protein S6--L-glutamate ligase
MQRGSVRFSSTLLRDAFLMTKAPVIVYDNKTLRKIYHDLQPGDLVVGRISCQAAEEYILFDLADRGVQMMPSALSQLVCRSKVFQTTIFSAWMLPGTVAVHDINQLQKVMQAMSDPEAGYVTKLDRKNAGMGVFRWPSLEDIFTQASLGVLPFPFVIQKFVPECRDIRVVVLGDFVEAYWRENKTSFRNNLHFGGISKSCDLNEEQRSLCEEVMVRGKFPYAHLDLMVTKEGATFLTEINLRGGIKGAQIKSSDYRRKIDAIHQKAVENHTSCPLNRA